MEDWHFYGSDYVCDLRVAGVLIRNGKLLVQRERNGNEYALPGGHVKIGEVMTDSLIREFAEETGANIECRKLLWTEECFWEQRGKMIHNISFYYQINLCSESDIHDNGMFFNQLDNKKVVFGWIPVEEIDFMTIYPDFLKQAIRNLDAPATHYVSYA